MVKLTSPGYLYDSTFPLFCRIVPFGPVNMPFGELSTYFGSVMVSETVTNLLTNELILLYAMKSNTGIPFYIQGINIGSPSNFVKKVVFSLGI